MRLFALGDPHLSFDAAGASYKPMGIFGGDWQDHEARLRDGWRRTVTEEDVVVLAGDISWAMTLEDARPDLDFLAALPGRKILLKGNHDLWWDSVGKVRRVLPAGMAALQNDCVLLGDTALCGTRGWLCPDDAADPHDEKIFRRELIRLRLSLESAPEAARKIVAMHFPPFSGKQEKSAFIDLMQEFGVTHCVYGHLHSHARRTALEGRHWGIELRLVSADHLDFTPAFIAQL